MSLRHMGDTALVPIVYLTAHQKVTRLEVDKKRQRDIDIYYTNYNVQKGSRCESTSSHSVKPWGSAA